MRFSCTGGWLSAYGPGLDVDRDRQGVVEICGEALRFQSCTSLHLLKISLVIVQDDRGTTVNTSE